MHNRTAVSTRRLTKIICTLGPSSNTKEKINALTDAGMNIARINLSHATWEDHAKVIRIIHAVNKENAKKKVPVAPVAVLIDTKGAEVRTGVVDTPLTVAQGEVVIFSYKPVKNADKQVILVNHKYFREDAQDAESIVIDNGKMTFTLTKVRSDGAIEAKSNDHGTIGSRRHVNLPGANLRMPSLTEKDWEDVGHAAEIDADFIALSFIREASEIEEVRAWLKKRKSNIALIAKMETRQCVENMREIIEVSDGIMVARGDLGSEVPFERIPVIQDELVRLTRQAGKPVIVATHMLESMIENPTPTRAEVTDIAHAATTGTDSTMLSGETANGQHPLLSIGAMDRVLFETEKHIATLHGMKPAPIRSSRDAQAQSAVDLALLSSASAILVMTRSGQTALDVSRLRPMLPIVTATPEPSTQRRLQLSFGVFPVLVPFSGDPEKTVKVAVNAALHACLLKKGQTFVLVSDAKAHDKNVSTIQVRVAE